jgi:hypothetical protein
MKNSNQIKSDGPTQKNKLDGVLSAPFKTALSKCTFCHLRLCTYNTYHTHAKIEIKIEFESQHQKQVFDYASIMPSLYVCNKCA